MKPIWKRVLWGLALGVLAAVLVLANLPEKQTAAPGTEVGEALPDFTVECLDGSLFRLREQRGRVVVINVWATWCTPCVKELPSFDRLLEEHPTEVAVLALHALPVTTDMRDWLSGFSYRIPFAVDEDGSLGEALKLSTVLPQTVILSPEGIVTYNECGALSYEKLAELVEAARQ